MSSEQRKALNVLGMKSAKFTEEELKSSFRTCLSRPHDSLLELCRSAFVLYKEVKTYIAAPIWQELFEKCLQSGHFTSQKIEMCLNGFDSIAHKVFFDELKRKFKGDYKIQRENIVFTVKDICVPYDRRKNIFGDVIDGLTTSKRKLLLTIAGDSAMIFVAFYLKQVLMAFWKNCQGSSLEQLYLSPHSSVSSSDSSDQGNSEHCHAKQIVQEAFDTLPGISDSNHSASSVDESDAKETDEEVKDPLECSSLPNISAYNHTELLDLTPNESVEEQKEEVQQEVEEDVLGGDSPIIKTKQKKLAEETETVQKCQTPCDSSPSSSLEIEGNEQLLTLIIMKLSNCFRLQ